MKLNNDIDILLPLDKELDYEWQQEILKWDKPTLISELKGAHKTIDMYRRILIEMACQKSQS